MYLKETMQVLIWDVKNKISHLNQWLILNIPYYGMLIHSLQCNNVTRNLLKLADDQRPTHHPRLRKSCLLA